MAITGLYPTSSNPVGWSKRAEIILDVSNGGGEALEVLDVDEMDEEWDEVDDLDEFGKLDEEAGVEEVDIVDAVDEVGEVDEVDKEDEWDIVDEVILAVGDEADDPLGVVGILELSSSNFDLASRYPPSADLLYHSIAAL